MALFGVIGYVLRKLDFPLAPVVLTLILGPLMERSLMQSLEISQGSLLVFLKSPIAAVFLLLTVLVLVVPALKSIRRSKEVMSREEPT
jgi:putative tricarboxylic transport membrane protein